MAAVLTFFAIRLGGRPADEDHPYGQRRAENLGAFGEAAILAGGGVFIVVEAIGQLTSGAESLEARWYVFAVIGIAILIDVSRIVVSLRTARRARDRGPRTGVPRGRGGRPPRSVEWYDPLLGLVALLALSVLLGLAARRYASHPLRLTGPLGHALNCTVIVALVANPYTGGAAALLYAATVVSRPASPAGSSP